MSPPISVIDLPYFQDSHVYFNALKQLKGCSWLDSGVESSQFDILSAEPIAHFSNVNAEFLQNQLERLRLNHQPSSFGDLPFTGGLIGYTCYEHQHPEFGLHPHQSGRNSNFWYLYDWALIQDHKLKKCSAIFLASCSNEAQSKTLSLLNNAHKLPRASSEAFSTSSFIPDMSRSYYSEAFKKIKDYILAGDVYQVNFSQRFKAKFEGEIPAAYMHLRTKLSGSYSAYFDTGHEHILSFSQSSLFRLREQKRKLNL